MNMGEKLRTLRLNRNLTQKQIADRIGLAISAISSYESGMRYPSYETLIKLARIFHVSTDYLLGVNSKQTVDVSNLSENQINILKNIIEEFKEK